MESEHAIIGKVMGAKVSSRAADELVREYLPFIKKEVSKLSEVSDPEYEDHLSIAMFAFHEAVLAYSKNKGSFLKFAEVVIKNRLIDYHRKSMRHSAVISLDAEYGGDDRRSMLSEYDPGEDNVAERHNANAAREEIEEFSKALWSFGLMISDIADNCPKQKRTLYACHKVLLFAKGRPEIFEELLRTKRLPVSALSSGTGLERKLIERHRKYLVAVLLAYTNGFEIIRGHLKQISAREGRE
ncbi:MAG: RNA polymerase subunit sigma [Ruminococcaceae bacterium]|nr:RNA polymerase subunit sigma [Oscillospiraceae bacterium]